MAQTSNQIENVDASAIMTAFLDGIKKRAKESGAESFDKVAQTQGIGTAVQMGDKFNEVHEKDVLQKLTSTDASGQQFTDMGGQQTQPQQMDQNSILQQLMGQQQGQQPLNMWQRMGGVGDILQGKGYADTMKKLQGNEDDPALIMQRLLKNQLLAQQVSGGGDRNAIRKENFLKLNTMQSGPSFVSDEELADPFISKIVKPIIDKYKIEPTVDEEGRKVYALEPLSYYKTKSTTTGKEEATRNIKREDAMQKLDDFFAVDEIIDDARAEGGLAETKVAKAKMSLAAWDQNSPLGMAVKQHNALRGNVALSMNRGFGDVGPIREDERKIAMELLPLLDDAKGTASLKRVLIKEMYKSFDDKDQTGFRNVLKKWKEQNGNISKSEESGVQGNQTKSGNTFRRIQ
jgi:hypothetical protein